MCIGKVFRENEGLLSFYDVIFLGLQPSLFEIVFSVHVSYQDGIVKKDTDYLYFRRNLVNVLDCIRYYSTVWRLNAASCSCVNKPSLLIFNFGSPQLFM